MTENYENLIGKEVEASVFGDGWFNTTLLKIHPYKVVVNCNPIMEKVIKTFTVEHDGHKSIVGHIRPIRKFKEGDKVYALSGDEAVVEDYSKNGFVWVKIEKSGLTYMCHENNLTKRPESFFGGVDFCVETSMGVMPGELVYMDTDSLFIQEYCAPPIGDAVEKAPETYTEAPVRKFKKGNEVVSTRDGYHGTVVGYQGDRVEVRHDICGSVYWGIYDESDLEFDEESEDDGTIVEASKDMTAEEKLGKVYEFAKELGVDVNEITGRKGCIGLVVRK